MYALSCVVYLTASVGTLCIWQKAKQVACLGGPIMLTLSVTYDNTTGSI